MQTGAAEPDGITSAIKTMGAGVFLCIPVIWLIAIVTAKENPVPIGIQGCYKNGQQTLQVGSRRIIVNGNLSHDVRVRYLVTNVGGFIEMVGESWLDLDPTKPPHKEVGRNMSISVRDNALVAFTQNGEHIPFAKAAPNPGCRNVSNWPSPA